MTTPRTFRVTFSPKSRQDLLEIGDFIARDSRENARRFVTKLSEHCGRIGRAPLSYPSRPDILPGIRISPLGRYVIFFTVDDDVVRIERVLHGARNLPTLLRTPHKPGAGEETAP